jgi:tight adherence protein C
VRRLAPVAAPSAGLAPSHTLVWRDLVNRIGSAVPSSGRDLPRLKRRLIRAGFRDPNAARYVQGIRPVTTLLFAAGAFAGGWQWHAAPDNLIWGTVAGAAFGYLAPMQYVTLLIRRRQRAIARGLPNALDLMVVCVESGLGIDQTMLQVAKELQTAHPEICNEFTVMNLELRAGKRRADALHNLADRTGVEDVKKLVAVLVQTDRFGTSIAQCLRGHADYLRTMARQRAEERASKLAVKLVFPIFFCVLPALFVVTIGPVMVHLVRDLVPMIENM